MPRRADLRSTIVDGSYEIPLEISARIDILKAMREYCWDLYGNEDLGFDWKEVDDATLEQWASRHVDFYHEAEDMIEECARQGHMLEPKEIEKYRDYHKVKAEIINGILISRNRAK